METNQVDPPHPNDGDDHSPVDENEEDAAAGVEDDFIDDDSVSDSAPYPSEQHRSKFNMEAFGSDFIPDENGVLPIPKPTKDNHNVAFKSDIDNYIYVMEHWATGDPNHDDVNMHSRKKF
jgi:hypothetical protein